MDPGQRQLDPNNPRGVPGDKHHSYGDTQKLGPTSLFAQRNDVKATTENQGNQAPVLSCGIDLGQDHPGHPYDKQKDSTIDWPVH